MVKGNVYKKQLLNFKNSAAVFPQSIYKWVDIAILQSEAFKLLIESINKFSSNVSFIFGFIFRVCFISAIAFIGYKWFEPISLMGIPLSQLTPGMLTSNLLCGLTFLGCLRWFFSFPEKQEGHSQDNPYTPWTWLGMFVLLCVFLFFSIV